jgi:hypothetical protein
MAESSTSGSIAFSYFLSDVFLKGELFYFDGELLFIFLGDSMLKQLNNL